VADTDDAFPLDSTEHVDTDGDGVGNNADADADTDGDGVADTADAFPLDPTGSADSDGDGVVDMAVPETASVVSQVIQYTSSGPLAHTPDIVSGTMQGKRASGVTVVKFSQVTYSSGGKQTGIEGASV
jgi:hypothetical protein